MKIAVFAATGGVGSQVLKQAIAAGHDVTAVVRHAERLGSGVPFVVADLSDPDPAVLESAVAGADGVISGLGQRSRSDSGITSRGTAAIIQAMRATDVRRLVVISAAPISTVASPGRPHPPKRDPGDGFWTSHLLTPMIKTILRTPYAHLALMEDDVRESGLDWTIVRPPRLTNGPLTGTYRTAFEQSAGLAISRADVAHLMLGVLTRPETVAHAIGIAN
jgi:putative NADH-flavin reductase